MLLLTCVPLPLFLVFASPFFLLVVHLVTVPCFLYESVLFKALLSIHFRILNVRPAWPSRGIPPSRSFPTPILPHATRSTHTAMAPLSSTKHKKLLPSSLSLVLICEQRHLVRYGPHTPSSMPRRHDLHLPLAPNLSKSVSSAFDLKNLLDHWRTLPLSST